METALAKILFILFSLSTASPSAIQANADWALRDKTVKIGKKIENWISKNGENFFSFLKKHPTMIGSGAIVGILLCAWKMLKKVQNAKLEDLLKKEKKKNRNKLKQNLESDIDVNAQDDDGFTALMEASAQGNLELITFLVNNGANVNIQSSDGVTALMVTALGGHLKIVKFLVNNGADVDQQNNDGWSALMVATNGNLEIVQFLVNSGTLTLICKIRMVIHR